MVKLSSVDRARSIGHLEDGWKQRDVAVLVGGVQSTISKLRLRYRDTVTFLGFIILLASNSVSYISWPRRHSIG